MITNLRNKAFSFVFLTLIIVLQSCSLDSVYEQKVDFKNYTWNEDSIQNFTFNIEEKGKYNLYYIVKNKSDYPFSNLYLKSNLRSGNSSVSQKLQEITLFDKKTGKPFGRGFGGTMEGKFYSLQGVSLDKGEHNLAVQQYMRVPNLEGIIAFGVRVDKVTN